MNLSDFNSISMLDGYKIGYKWVEVCILSHYHLFIIFLQWPLWEQRIHGIKDMLWENK